MYSIYAHINKINGKVYVGFTSKSIAKRWSEHCRRARYHCKLNNGNYFQRAIVKYGADNWEAKLLEVCDLLEAADAAETKWIAYYKSNQKEFGYNLTPGGNISQSSIDPRVREKISKSVTKIMADPQIRAKNSEFMKNWLKENGNPFLGRTHSDESLEKMSKAVKDWHKTHDNPFKGKKHNEDTRRRMSEAAKIRCADPNWQPPMVKNGVPKKPESVYEWLPRIENHQEVNFALKNSYVN
jgi:group I intron endonuclease